LLLSKGPDTVPKATRILMKFPAVNPVVPALLQETLPAVTPFAVIVQASDVAVGLADCTVAAVPCTRVIVALPAVPPEYPAL
jgi:hypothetical protein